MQLLGINLVRKKKEKSSLFCLIDVRSWNDREIRKLIFFLGEAELKVNCDDTGSSELQIKRNAGEFQGKELKYNAKIITLDELVQEDVLLLKIDVEGLEAKVLNGSLKLFQKFEVRHLVCETKWKREEEWKRQWMNSAMEKGYRLFAYKERYGIVKNLDKFVNPESQLVSIQKLAPKQWIPAQGTS